MSAVGPTESVDEEVPARRGALGQLVAGTARYFVIGVIARGIQLVSVPVLLRLLSADEFGVQAIALLNEQLLMIVAGYAFTNAVSKHYADARLEGRNTGVVVGTAIAGVSVAGTAAFVLWQLAAPLVGDLTLHGASDATAITRLVGISAVANLVVTVVTSVWQLDERYLAYGIATIGQYTAFVVLGVALVVTTDLGAAGVVIGWTASSVVCAVGCLARLRHEQQLAVDRTVARSLLRYGAPLVPAAFIMLVLTTNDRYLLVRLDGLGAVGVYAAVLTIVNGVNTGLVAPFKRSLLPMMWRLRGDPGEQAFHRRAFTLYWTVQAWVTLAFLVFGGLVMALLSGGDDAFERRGPALAIVYGGFVLLNSYDFLSAGYFFEGRTVYYPITVAVATVVAVAWNVVLIPHWDLWAAALSNPVSYAVFAVLSWRFGRRFFAVDYEWGRILAALGLASALGAAAVAAKLLGTAGALGVGAACVAAYPVLLLVLRVLSDDERQAVRRVLAGLRSVPAG